MSEYGLTPTGLNLKRMDTILSELHDDLSEGWGVNTRQNPRSFLGHLLTNLSDQLAALWEFGAEVYYSQYPSTAEDVSLDHAAQLGGSTREAAAPSRYLIHCTGTEGTTLDPGTLIASDTSPRTLLYLRDSRTIRRDAFNRAVVRVAALTGGSPYTVAINAAVYSIDPGNLEDLTAEHVLQALQTVVTEPGFTLTAEGEQLTIQAEDLTSTNTLVLSENLTTDSVTSIFTFRTRDTGDILLPDGVISTIVQGPPGLTSVRNLCGYIPGRDRQTDTEFRQAYADKIFLRSSGMLESIRAAILENVQGAVSVAPYENPTDQTDDWGRPPHSIEIVVDGGASDEIALQILENKAGGINTFGDVAVVVPGAYDEDITIRFSRPQRVYTWFRLGLTLSGHEALPPNYGELLRTAVLGYMETLEAGADVTPQTFVSELYRACSGIGYIDVGLFCTTDPLGRPGDYALRSAAVTARQRAYTAEEMIEVEING